MEKSTRKRVTLREGNAAALGILIHAGVRAAIEEAIQEELAVALGALRYQRVDERSGYRNGWKERTLTTPSGPTQLDVPRGILVDGRGRRQEWVSKMLPRYQRRMAEVNEAVAAVYLSGCNTRRLRGALRPLLKAAPLSRSAVSRVVQTLRSSLEAWQKRPLDEIDVAYLYLDAIALRVRMAGKVTSTPVLVAVAVFSDGSKQLVALEMCGSESHASWKGFLDDLVKRGIKRPILCVVDGCAGLRSAIDLVWAHIDVQRCTVHKLRNIQRKAPKHAYEEIKEDFHRIVYAKSEVEAKKAWSDFVARWRKPCPGVVRSIEEGGDELLTFFRYPKSQWKTLRTTNAIERLNGEFRRRVKTQASLPTEDAALVLLFGLVASGQVKLRRIDGHKDIAKVLSQHVQSQMKAA